MLKSIHKCTHLRNFAGQTLGVDAYGWLHRGTVSCAIELAQGKPTRKHIEFALSRVRMLIHFGVKPYLVFDGDYLPSKAHTEKERAARRKESKKLGLDLLGMGRVSQAYLELQKAIDVTPSMARELIEELKRLNVPYVVAPYEADSQLAYLEKQGIISGVLSEDSDLLVFGVKSLLTKLDQYGECVVVNRADFTACREISLVGWTDKEFRIMAMLSGCDYLPGIDKMGLKTAYRLVRKHKVIERIVRTVQFDGKMKVPTGYLEAFTKAERTFLYQWVFCPEARGLMNLNKLPSDLEAESMPYIGKQVEAEIAIGVATGDLDPNTKLPLAGSNSYLQHPSRRPSVRQTPDEKQGKPISEFFKPKRTPLAELDPNSFTPSPSQQRLLQDQQGLSWSASQVQPTRTSMLNRIPSTNGELSAPQATRRVMSDLGPNKTRSSPKRQRLCSDSVFAASMGGSVGLETATSRFFSKQNMQPSPSRRKASARKKDDFELWSDDSAAEAVAAMTATPEVAIVKETPTPKKRKKINVYEDPEPVKVVRKVQHGSKSADTSQETIASMVSADSPKTAGGDTPPSSVEEVKGQQLEPTVFSKGVNADFARLKSKFSFDSACSVKTGLRTKSASMTSRSALQEAERNSLLGRLAVPPSWGTESKEPWNLMRVGKEQSEEYTAGVSRSSSIASPTLADENRHDETIDDEEWLEFEQREANNKPQAIVQGSEDLLIPNSPESSEDGGSSMPQLDLGRFAFAG